MSRRIAIWISILVVFVACVVAAAVNRADAVGSIIDPLTRWPE